ncbi:anti-sigma factor family protein [Massilia endophytica]|uniref:anti-sigma factor family protein n=1 Tax=Massilia endophytica TaxID=2899220 RepID=UPI001E51F0B8|nr:anti-sigma factor [Massilia endophytica]UGQ46857.1 anti-sigma factor [Massilia endophytica]
MNTVSEAELQAWVDGRLPAARRAAVDQYLNDHPQEAKRLRAYREQNAGLRALFNPVLDETLPPSLAGVPQRRWRLPSQRLVAGLAIAVGAGLLGGAGGWMLHDRLQQDDAVLAAQARTALPRQAALAHAVYSPEVRHPVEVGADQQQHLVAWLSKRLGAALRPPLLAQQGYELVGGRLLPGDSGPVAQFMYADAAGQRLTLYVSPGQRGKQDTGFRFAQEGAVSVFYWIDGSFGYALSASVPKARLADIADAVYRQLEP